MAGGERNVPELQAAHLGRLSLTRSSAGRSIGSDAGPPLPPGTMVNEFQIESRVGEGGMGEVYLAVHPVIDKKVAIKVMRPSLCTDEVAVERFVQEARAVNRIGHPSLVDVFAFGRLPDGRSFFIMEWLRGETVAKALSTRGLSTADCIDILLPVCDALEAAHAHQIVHRDLKPENIFLVSMRKQRTTVKLLDFGIAKLLGDEVAGQERTQQGKWVGTPSYMSPEQARAQKIDVRSDIYSLGVTAYEMFLGRVPFSGATAVDVIAMHLNDTPPAPENSWLTVPPELSALLLQMLAKSPDERPTLSQITSTLQRLRPAFATGTGVASSSASGGVVPEPTPAASAAVSLATPDGTLAAAAAMAPAPAQSEPATPGDAVLPASVSISAPVPDRSRRRFAVAIAIVSFAAVAAAIGWNTAERRGATAVQSPLTLDVQRTAPMPVSPAKTPAQPAAETAAALPAPSTTSLELRVTVPALIELDGTAIAEASRTATLTISGNASHQLVVSAPGFHPYREALLTGSTGGSLRRSIKLQRARAGSSSHHQRGVAPSPRQDILDPFAQP